MSHPETDTLRLRHMLDAARAALSFTSGRTRDDLSADLMLQFALVRALEIVGEAAARISEPTRTGHPEIPWTAIIGMRNRLVQGYFDVDLENRLADGHSVVAGFDRDPRIAPLPTTERTVSEVPTFSCT